MNPIPRTLILVCALFLFPYAFFTFEFFPFLFTSTILFLSVLFLLRITKKKESLDFYEIPDSRFHLEPENVETVSEDEVVSKEIGSQMESTQSPSDSDSNIDDDDDDDDSDTSENLDDLVWIQNQDPEMSDDDDSVSIDDEDGLIEINIPKQNFPEASIFRHQDWAEFLAEFNEVNEEENLIEIDISMGSIKCPRFEIEA